MINSKFFYLVCIIISPDYLYRVERIKAKTAIIYIAINAIIPTILLPNDLAKKLMIIDEN